MNSSIDALVKNLSDNDSKYISREFRGDLPELVKQKGVYPYEYMDSFKKFSEDKLPGRCKYFSNIKMNVSVKKIIHVLLLLGICLK